MPKREPKAKFSTEIEVVGRNGSLKGRLQVTSGNITYYRVNANTASLKLTHQQLLSLLEKEIEYKKINSTNTPMPKPHYAADFILCYSEFEDNIETPSNFYISLDKLDARRIDCGQYQFSYSMSKGRKYKNINWFAVVSVQAALWIIDKYIDKWITEVPSGDHVDEDVVVSKNSLRNILMSFVKRISKQ